MSKNNKTQNRPLSINTVPVVGTVIGAACGIGIGLLIDWGSEEPKKYWKGLVESEKKRV